MIMVDVFVPALDSTYDFQLDEQVQVDKLTEEIAEMLNSELRLGRKSDMNQFILCSMDDEIVLDKNTTLLKSGIRNGGRLMLV